MFSRKGIEHVKSDIVFVSTITITSGFINYYLTGLHLFDDMWLLSSFSLLIAFIFHSFITRDLINVEESNFRLKKTVDDVIRFGTLFFISEISTSILLYDKIILTYEFLIRTIMALSGLAFFDMVFAERLINEGVYTLLIYDVFRISASSLGATLLINGNISLLNFADTVGIVSGFSLWHLITNRMIVL